MREDVTFPSASASRAAVRGASHDLEHAPDEARKALVRAARAVERAGLELEWVRRLARRLAKLREGRGVRR